jgi:cytochrome bd-type quinol oxidase subunit 2
MKHAVRFTYYNVLAALLVLPVTTFAQFNPNNAEDADLPDATIYDILRNIMLWLTALIAIIAVIGFVIAGVLYLLSAGSEQQADRAKRALLYSIIGVIVALIGFIILQAADTMLEASSSEF